MSYDTWKSTNPADEFLGPAPIEDRAEASLIQFQGAAEPRIITRYDPKPVPTAAFDWSAVEDSYDLGRPVGYGATREAAIRDLLDQLEE